LKIKTNEDNRNAEHADLTDFRGFFISRKIREHPRLSASSAFLLSKKKLTNLKNKKIIHKPELIIEFEKEIIKILNEDGSTANIFLYFIYFQS